VFLVGAGAGEWGDPAAEAKRVVKVVRSCVGDAGLEATRAGGIRALRSALEVMEEEDEEDEEEE